MHMSLLKDKILDKCYYYEDKFEINQKIKEVVREVFDNVAAR